MSDPPHLSTQVDDAAWLSLGEAIDHVTTNADRTRRASILEEAQKLRESFDDRARDLARWEWSNPELAHRNALASDAQREQLGKKLNELNQELEDIARGTVEILRTLLCDGKAVAKTFNEYEEPVKLLNTIFWQNHIVWKLPKLGWQIVELAASTKPDGGISLKDWKTPFPHKVKIAFKPLQTATIAPGAPANVAADQVKREPKERGRPLRSGLNWGPALDKMEELLRSGTVTSAQKAAEHEGVRTLNPSKAADNVKSICRQFTERHHDKRRNETWKDYFKRKCQTRDPSA